MEVKTKRRILIILILPVVLILIGYSYSGFKKSHTFTLSDEVTASSNLKSEQIQIDSWNRQGMGYTGHRCLGYGC